MNLAVLAHPRFCEDLARLIVEFMIPSSADDWVLACTIKGPGRWGLGLEFDTEQQCDDFMWAWRLHPRITLSRTYIPYLCKWHAHAVCYVT